MEKPRVHYGWVVAAAGAMTVFSCLGLARFAYGMLLPLMGKSLSLRYDEMGFIGTGNFAGYLAAVALAPVCMKRWGGAGRSRRASRSWPRRWSSSGPATDSFRSFASTS